MSTGVYSTNNCAPTSLAMIFNYLSVPYKSVSWVRSLITRSGGWVYTNEIEDYLLKEGMEYNIEYISEEKDIINNLNNGDIVMLCVDISKVRYSSNKYVGRQFTGGTGHFIVVTGYYMDDDMTVFEVLDPMNKGVRYYDSKELLESIVSWWSFCFTFNSKDYKQPTIQNK